MRPPRLLASASFFGTRLLPGAGGRPDTAPGHRAAMAAAGERERELRFYRELPKVVSAGPRGAAGGVPHRAALPCCPGPPEPFLPSRPPSFAGSFWGDEASAPGAPRYRPRYRPQPRLPVRALPGLRRG